jgi:hypothetical protein
MIVSQIIYLNAKAHSSCSNPFPLSAPDIHETYVNSLGGKTVVFKWIGKNTIALTCLDAVAALYS